MPLDLKSIDSVYLLLGFVVPGLIMTFVRAQFITGRIPPYREIWLAYLTQSAVYYALVLPVAEVVMAQPPGYRRALTWALLVFVGPVLMGLFLGLNARYGLIRKFLVWLRMPTVHVMPTAWDWKFSDNQPHWLLVVLKNGTKFAGFFGRASFASSDPAERDLYIEKVYDLDDNNNWIDRGEKGVLLIANEIRSIEFFPHTEGTAHGD